MIELSIIIPAYNQQEYTRQCLDALFLSGLVPSRHEIIVVDNASSDETPELLADYGSRYSLLRSIRHENNIYFAGACNSGASIANGSVLVFLNNDTIPLQGWFNSPLEILLSSGTIGVVGSKLLYPDRTVQHCGIEFAERHDLPYPLCFWPEHRYRNADENDPLVNRAEEVTFVTGACLFVRSDIFRSINGFPTEYGMYFEDMDFCIQVRKRGFKIWYEPSSVLIHFEGKSSNNQLHIDEKNRDSARLFYAKYADVIDKHMSWKLSLIKKYRRFKIFKRELENRLKPLFSSAIKR